MTPGKEIHIIMYRPTLFISSVCCGFADEDDASYILTGGAFTKTTVSKYSQSGWIEDLPSLNTGRYWHGCGTYLDSSNQQVRIKY